MQTANETPVLIQIKGALIDCNQLFTGLLSTTALSAEQQQEVSEQIKFNNSLLKPVDAIKRNRQAVMITGSAMDNGKFLDSFIDGSRVIGEEVDKVDVSRFLKRAYINDISIMIQHVEGGFYIRRIKELGPDHLTLNAINKDKETYPDCDLALNDIDKVFDITDYDPDYSLDLALNEQNNKQ
jgi:hypothetical protein